MTVLIKQSVNEAMSVTPSDSTSIKPTKGIYVGVSGDLSAVLDGGSIVVFKDLAAGVVHQLAVKQVKSTGTTATDILALYY